ncbi:MAG: threonine synthase [Chloroflexi bacterium]|nr:threonine synthase [Chloroflexota bacterium]|tara:strand:+ start:23133 stop:24236 length:1104 start_codon:yes stop_codon:yes gene_type:complete
MEKYIFKCTNCSKIFKPSLSTLECFSCNDPLIIEYNNTRKISSDYIQLPLKSKYNLTLGEGNTPIIKMDKFSRLFGLDNVFAKLEFLNPTGSFKDRGSQILLSVICENKINEIVEDSSGNAGASISSYSARAGVKANIFVPSSAPLAKINQINVYGGKIHKVEGPRENATKEALNYCRENNLIYASHNASPYFLEGIKSFAYEVFNQCTNNFPDHIIIPVGNGSLILGAFLGFNELYKFGFLNKIPKLHAIQANNIMPITSAFNNQCWEGSMASQTIAGGISAINPPRLLQILNVIKQTSGSSFAISESEILKYQKLLSKLEGIYMEPTSAVPFASIENLINAKIINQSDNILIPITGLGLKDKPPV